MKYLTPSMASLPSPHILVRSFRRSPEITYLVGKASGVTRDRSSRLLRSLRKVIWLPKMLCLKQPVCDGHVLRKWKALMKSVNVSGKFLISVDVRSPRSGLSMAIDAEVTNVNNFTRC